ncbi:MAG: alpha/beta fold hydrolase [Boseongicola sp. SB0676_bin_33]|uniref:Alpha/beta fold hydrolase n=1 Tax=Boseongicola sp. SB0664_bin_43 TaxID=2604844 RepID=A0A6B0Y378_9RHOB|nr:alpha/beta fold hydrolase [Boseongicola sp. SB0664_bin_43]MYF90310.1 alpha/beta fold hydrolase [Boseongicola sp. SB0676_bin_33]MYK32059.1 alpha/beta fold hydrolase [Boseongicola sp. SB0670_bin_30]
MRAVFLHGFAADRLTWVGTTPAIPGIDAVTPDLPGHGKSISDLGDGSLEDLASRLIARIKRGPPVWLIGHSLGGGLALKLAAEMPELFRGLVLLAPIGLGRRLGIVPLKEYPELRDKDEMRRFLEPLVANEGVIAPMVVDNALRQLERDGARDALAKIADQLPTIDAELCALLPRVAEHGLDITVIWGTEDNVASPDRERIEKLGTLVELPGIGHIAHVEAQKQVNTLLADKIAGGTG